MNEIITVSIDRAKHTIVIADGDDVTRESVGRMLRAAEFKTIEAATAAQALALVTEAVSAVVLDVRLPEMTGFQLCQVVRARAETTTLPVICLSAQHEREEGKSRGLNAGADAYLVHPVNPAVLVATVQTLIRARGAEQALRLALNAAQQGTWSYHPSSGRAQWDQRCRDLWWLDPDVPVTYQLWLSRLHPDDRERVRAEMDRASDPASGGHFRSEYRIHDPLSGAERWIASTAQVVFDNGTAMHWYGTVQDITERKLAVEALAEQRRLYKSVTDNASTALFIMDDRQRCVFMNPAAQRLTGFSLDEVRGRVLHDVVHHTRPDGSHYPLSQCPIDRAFPRNDREHGEEVFVHKDGHFYHVAFTASPVRDEQGSPVGTVIEVQDITHRKDAEDRLRRSEAIYRHLADANLFGVGFGNGRGGITFVNDEMLRMMGRTRADFEAGHINWMEAIAPEFRETAARETQRVLHEGRAKGHESAFLRPDGGRTPYLAAAALVTPGEELHVSIALDLSEIKSAEAALREADRKKDEFLAMLAHELRNPLAPIVTVLELMRRSAADPERVERLRETMQRQVAHVVRLVDDLMDVSRIKSNKLHLNKGRVELSTVLRDALEVAGPHCEELGHRIDVRLPSESLWLDADRVRLTQVFGNLLTNACKYTLPGGSIWLRAAREADEVVVSVADTGVGIPRDMLSSVFDAFTQVDSTIGKSRGGLGIGLSLVKWLVEMHGGVVTAHSDGPGRGSQFLVRLPLTGPAETSAAPQPLNLTSPLAGRRILIVDDNEDNARTLAELVEMDQGQPRVAFDGYSALQELGICWPDIVLLDIGLPGMSGYQVCERIRSQASGKDVVIVALTGWGQEEDRRRSRQAGFDGHLAKPVSYSELTQLLASLAVR